MNKEFLFELGCEELPSRMQEKLARELVEKTLAALTSIGNFQRDDILLNEQSLWVTPRRIAVRLSLPAAQSDKIVELWGPPKSVAFDNAGKPTKAAEVFAQKNGLSLADASVANDGKVDKLFFRKVVTGRNSIDILPEVIASAVNGLSLAKPMRWGAQTYSFIRPVHWLLALLDDEIIPVELFGLKADRVTYGHRFHAPQAIHLHAAADYEEALLKARVVVAWQARKQSIQQQVERVAKAAGAQSVFGQSGFNGDSWAMLLDEVTGIVEWPVALVGEFEQRFLAVPQECLISTMRDNQRYFHLVDVQGKLLNKFIVITNINSSNPVSITEGNAKVIRPRFADAEFFFMTDKKKKLDDRRAALSNVVFQQQLGTVADKANRVAELAEKIARELNGNAIKARRAAELYKCDLLSLMVNEFPELQGIMGQYYALTDGEDSEVANALREHYLPKFSGDELPQTSTGIALAIADRIDTLVGIFGIGQAPSGAKDPFALRRAAIGLLRIIVEKNLNLDLRLLLQWSRDLLGERISQKDVVDEAIAFVLERFRAGYQDAGISTEIINAVMSLTPTRPLDFDKRIKAVQSFVTVPESAALAAANKRVRNILAKADLPLSNLVIEEGALIEVAEQQLAQALRAARADTLRPYASGDYTAVLLRLATLQAPVDRFFTDVMVNTPHEQIRRNRYALLSELQSLFSAVADISQLPG